MDHIAFAQEEVDDLAQYGWTVKRHVSDPHQCWMLEKDTKDLAEKPGEDPLGTLAFLRFALSAPLWVPTSKNVLAHTVVGHGNVTLLCSRSRALLSECLHDPTGSTFQVDVGVAQLENAQQVLAVFKDALTGHQVTMVRVATLDDKGEGMYLDFFLKTAALVVGFLAKEENEVSQVPQEKDPSPADNTKH